MEQLKIHAVDFYNWLDTCPVHWRHRKQDGDYLEIGFFEIVYGEEE